MQEQDAAECGGGRGGVRERKGKSERGREREREREGGREKGRERERERDREREREGEREEGAPTNGAPAAATRSSGCGARSSK